MINLMWFRSDLRLDDNPAFQACCESSDEVQAVFIYSEKQLNSHNEANIKVDFLIQNIFSLEKKLALLNIPLTIVKSDGFIADPKIITDLVKTRNIDNIFWNKQFGEDEMTRDKLVQDELNALGIKHKSFHDQVVYEPGTLKTGQGTSYSVFTPFKRKWIENFNMEFLDLDYNYEKKSKGALKSNLLEFDFSFKKTHQVDMSLWNEGEEAALKRLNNFLDQKAINYSKDRNDPIIDGTSRISPYLTIGVISPKRCILEALKANNFEFSSGHIGITKWIDEIVWREFYRNIMFSFPRVSRKQPFQNFSKLIKWRFDEAEFKAWKDGQTGFPIIDAAMRQLLHEGWMHNRLRMVVAMFFTKNMLHDWRLGEEYFMQNLIDGDFASNNGGWQWSSSTGTDAAPYFRIFNPITQSTNFDKEGLFIKKYVPELTQLDKSIIHNPPSNHRKYCNYKEMILDLKYSRLRAIDAFKLAKN